jgi:hypothetical protein
LSATTEIVAVTDPRLPGLLADGWRVAHRSWAAQLDADRVDRDALLRMVGAATRGGRRTIRPLAGEDVPAVLALLERRVRVFRTGGAAENTAIIAVNSALGYVRDEEWVTLER